MFSVGLTGLNVWVRSKKKKVTHLSHVIEAMEYLRANVSVLDDDDEPPQDDNWALLWSYRWPFSTKFPRLKAYFQSLKTDHYINHFPGTNFMTSKVFMAKLEKDFIPKAFSFPQDNDAFQKYIEENPKAAFVQKSNAHRGVEIKRPEEMVLGQKDHFVQEFISDSLLVDGYKFDIGLYVLITSFDPFRLYVYDDVLLRLAQLLYYIVV